MANSLNKFLQVYKTLLIVSMHFTFNNGLSVKIVGVILNIYYVTIVKHVYLANDLLLVLSLFRILTR